MLNPVINFSSLRVMKMRATHNSFLLFLLASCLCCSPQTVYANRAAIKEHSHHEMEAYKKQLRLVQLLHARALSEETPTAPAAH
jgi:hypothetical protein